MVLWCVAYPLIPPLLAVLFIVRQLVPFHRAIPPIAIPHIESKARMNKFILIRSPKDWASYELYILLHEKPAALPGKEAQDKYSQLN